MATWYGNNGKQATYRGKSLASAQGRKWLKAAYPAATPMAARIGRFELCIIGNDVLVSATDLEIVDTLTGVSPAYRSKWIIRRRALHDRVRRVLSTRHPFYNDVIRAIMAETRDWPKPMLSTRS